MNVFQQLRAMWSAAAEREASRRAEEDRQLSEEWEVHVTVAESLGPKSFTFTCRGERWGTHPSFSGIITARDMAEARAQKYVKEGLWVDHYLYAPHRILGVKISKK